MGKYKLRTMSLKISFNRKILADFKMSGPKMVGLYSSGPNNGRNGFWRPS